MQFQKKKMISVFLQLCFYTLSSLRKKNRSQLSELQLKPLNVPQYFIFRPFSFDFVLLQNYKFIRSGSLIRNGLWKRELELGGFWSDVQ